MKKTIKNNIPILAILGLGLILRIYMIFLGYHGDLNNNISWAMLAVERGLRGFYEGKIWPYSQPNQPPLTILLFYIIGWSWQIISNSIWFINLKVGIFPSSIVWFWQRWGMIILIKIPSIMADFGIGVLIYGLVKRLTNRKNIALLAMIVWLFNPVVWYNSSVWGQTDSIVNFLGLLSVVYLLDKKCIKSALFFTLSVLFKGSLFIFAPLLIFVAIKTKIAFNKYFYMLVTAFVAVIVISVFFHPSADLLIWLARLYIDRFIPGEVGFLTANAFNFWWLVDPGRVLDSTLFAGLTARTWGFVVFIALYLLIIYSLDRKYVSGNIFYSLMMVALLSFLVMTRIHERYLYPFFPYATVLIFLNYRLVIPFVILSIVHLLNLYHLFWVPDIKILKDLYDVKVFPNLLALFNLGVFIYLLLTFFDKGGKKGVFR